MTPPPLESDGHELYLRPDNRSILVLPIDDWLTLIEAYSKLRLKDPGLWFNGVVTEEGYDANIEIHAKDPGTGDCYHLPVNPDGNFWARNSTATVREHVNKRFRGIGFRLTDTMTSLCSSKPSP